MSTSEAERHDACCITVLRHQDISAKLPAIRAGEEIDVGHGIVDVFAYQEALLIEAVFGIAILVMIWAGFRRWIRHKEDASRLMAEQTAERAAEFGALVERVEARLKAVEQLVTDGGQAPAQIDALPTDLIPKRDQV
jgi:hypothetical protein